MANNNKQQAPVLRAKGEKFQDEKMKSIMGWKLKEIIYNNLGERDFAMWKVMDYLITNASEGECVAKGKEPFRVSEEGICNRVNISESGYKGARKKLVAKGWIAHESGYITVLYDNIYKCGQGVSENTSEQGITENTSVKEKKQGFSENTSEGFSEYTPQGYSETSPVGVSENTHNNIRDNIIEQDKDNIMESPLPSSGACARELAQYPSSEESSLKQKEGKLGSEEIEKQAVPQVQSATEHVIKLVIPSETAIPTDKEPPKAPIKPKSIGYMRRSRIESDPTIHFALDTYQGIEGAWIWKDGDRVQEFKYFTPEH